MIGPMPALMLTCVECGREWFDPSERWRTFLTNEDEPALYCPACADAEFGETRAERKKSE